MKKIIVAILTTIGFAVGLSGAVQPVAATSDLDDNICEDSGISDELKEIAGCYENKRADTVVNDIIKIVSGVVVFLAVVVMIYGGFVFLTSSGDASKVAKGKKIVLYGVIGLIVAIMAFAIVTFVGKAVGR